MEQDKQLPSKFVPVK